jgi:hypothetical protein
MGAPDEANEFLISPDEIPLARFGKGRMGRSERILPKTAEIYFQGGSVMSQQVMVYYNPS